MAATDKTTLPQDEIETLKKEFGRLQADLASLTEALKRAGVSTAEQVKAQGAASLERVRTEAEALARQAAETGRTQLSDLEHRIKEQPLMSVALAFGIGLLFAMLGSRR
jgi:ElaB/YqjD/DUF883 family membrane-anchored ribosome-binding protein